MLCSGYFSSKGVDPPPLENIFSSLKNWAQASASKILLQNFFRSQNKQKSNSWKELFHFLKLAKSPPTYIKISHPKNRSCLVDIYQDTELGLSVKEEPWQLGQLVEIHLFSSPNIYCLCKHPKASLCYVCLQSLRNHCPKTFKISRGKYAKLNGSSISILNFTFWIIFYLRHSGWELTITWHPSCAFARYCIACSQTRDSL